jgi:nucleotide-binding universal stress UspA family protein
MKLLVAIDGSQPSEHALDYALSLAAATGGSVTAVHAVDPAVYEEAGGDPGGGVDERDDRFVMESETDAEERASRLLDEARESAADHDVTFETELLHGDPRETITAFAEEAGFEGIVVGHRGLSERQERVLGSVAKSFVEHASVPVTVVQ